MKPHGHRTLQKKQKCQRKGCGREFFNRRQKQTYCPSCYLRGFKNEYGARTKGLKQIDIDLLKLSVDKDA